MSHQRKALGPQKHSNFTPYQSYQNESVNDNQSTTSSSESEPESEEVNQNKQRSNVIEYYKNSNIRVNNSSNNNKLYDYINLNNKNDTFTDNDDDYDLASAGESYKVHSYQNSGLDKDVLGDLPTLASANNRHIHGSLGGFGNINNPYENIERDRDRDDTESVDEFNIYNNPSNNPYYGNILKNEKVVKTGRQRKKEAARSKGGEFQAKRKKKRIYFCCVASEIDVEKLYDYLITSNELQTQTSVQSQSLTQSILMNHNRLMNSFAKNASSGQTNQSYAGSSTQNSPWLLKMYSDVLHLHKPGRESIQTNNTPNNIPSTNTNVPGINLNDSARSTNDIPVRSGAISPHPPESSLFSPQATGFISPDFLSPMSTPFGGMQTTAPFSLSENTSTVNNGVPSASIVTNPIIQTSALDVSQNISVPVAPQLIRANSDVIYGGNTNVTGGTYPNSTLVSEEDNFTRISTSGAQEVFIFDFGAIVFWGFPRGEENHLLKTIRMFATKGYVHEDEFHFGEDDMAYVCTPLPTVDGAPISRQDSHDSHISPMGPLGLDHSNPNRNINELQGHTVEGGVHINPSTLITIANDVLTLPEDSPAKQRLSISFAIAQSTILAIFESRIDRKIVEYKYIPEQMALHGRIHLSEKQLGTMIGAIFCIRHDVNLHTEILDLPDFFWKDGQKYESDYKLIMSYLQMSDRTEVLNKRLDMMRELLSVLQQQMENHHGVKLEWIVIWLVFVEVLLQMAAIYVDSLSWQAKHNSEL